MVHDALLYRRRVGCHACNGDGVREPYQCPVCEGTGWRWMYRAASGGDIAAHLLATDSGPRPWRDGDERCHCTHCDACGRLYRTADLQQHRDVCPVARALRELQAVPRGVEPTPADLLTDPRVRALVEALSGAVGTLADHGSWQASQAATAALAPFEEVTP